VFIVEGFLTGKIKKFREPAKEEIRAVSTPMREFQL